MTTEKYPEMTLEIALQFADQKSKHCGPTTRDTLEILAAEVRRLQSDGARMDWLESRRRVDYSVGYWKPEEGETLRQRLDKIMPLYAQ